MSSTLTVTNLTATNLTDGGGTTSTFADINSGSAKAWVNFNQQGTYATRDSFNVASLTDNATGDATMNFSSNMGNNGYSFNACAGNGATSTDTSFIGPRDSDPSSSAIRMHDKNYNNTSVDRIFTAYSVTGDLA